MGCHIQSNVRQLLSLHFKRIIYTKQFCLQNVYGIRFTNYSLPGNKIARNFSHTPRVIRCNFSHSSSNHLFQSVKLLPASGIKNASYESEFEDGDNRFYGTIIWLLAKPLVKIVAIILGRSLRKRFWALNIEERQRVLSYFWNYTYIHLAAFGILIILTYIYYDSNITETPVTRRKRFISFSEEEADDIAQFQADVLLDVFKDHFLPTYDRRVERAKKVAEKLISSNPSVGKLTDTWKIYIINDSLVNAFVLPNGHIFVFTGILTISDTDDQLATVLGHEIAHAVLNHGVEILSLDAFVDWFLIISFLIIWFAIPSDILAFITMFWFDKIVELLIHMPASRRQEWEADHVGLIFAATACYDVREAGVLWRKIAQEQELRRTITSLPVWMGTHPDSIERAKFMDSLLADAEGWRKANGCPPLPNKGQNRRVNYILDESSEK